MAREARGDVWSSRGSCRHHRLEYLPMRKHSTGSGETIYQRICKTRRNLAVKAVYIGLLLCCIIEIEMLVNSHNGARLSFRRTLAITLRVCHSPEENLQPFCVPVAALIGMPLGHRHSTCLCPRHVRAAAPRLRDAQYLLRRV
jgi:hypothetical protein